MRTLIDKWSPAVFLIFIFLKIFQAFKAMGIKTGESGWRKIMGTYLRTEHSKFELAVFALDFLSDREKMETSSFEDARLHLKNRLADFLRDMPSIQWKLRWGKFRVSREKNVFVDIVDVEFSKDGSLELLSPHFDIKGPLFNELDQKKYNRICDAFIKEYNNVRDVMDEQRPLLLRKNLRKWVSGQQNISKKETQETLSFIDRVLCGSFIIFQTSDNDTSGSSKERFTPPDFINHKHAGFGLLNIVCRFNHLLNEADLWFQFQHAPVDGVPMQELLLNLKERWGIRQDLVYPSLKSAYQIAPQRCSTLKNKQALYQKVIFIDFRPLLKLRKRINKEYSDEMGGPATIISMLMWGLTRHHSLKDRKFLFPVELAECPATGRERAPSAIFIRPDHFTDQTDQIKGFLNFQYEFNRRMNNTRNRKSASYELIELYTLILPFFYTFSKKIMLRALGEFIGTVGITMIKDADLFITPLSDMQSDGFFAIGNMMVPTEDGNKAGCVSIRAEKEKIEQYIEAFSQLQSKLDNFFQNNRK